MGAEDRHISILLYCTEAVYARKGLLFFELQLLGAEDRRMSTPHEEAFAAALYRLHGSWATETSMRADTTYVWGILPVGPVTDEDVRERVSEGVVVEVSR